MDEGVSDEAQIWFATWRAWNIFLGVSGVDNSSMILDCGLVDATKEPASDEAPGF
jgi:hypothetical protein